MTALSKKTVDRNAGIDRLRERAALVARWEAEKTARRCAECNGMIGDDGPALCDVCEKEIADGMAQWENEKSPAFAELAEVRRILAPYLPALPLPCTCTDSSCDRCRLTRIICPVAVAPPVDALAADRMSDDTFADCPW
jgi:hypothetical protein